MTTLNDMRVIETIQVNELGCHHSQQNLNRRKENENHKVNTTRGFKGLASVSYIVE